MDLTMSSFGFTLKIFLDILYFNFMTYCNHLITLLVCYTVFLCTKKKCFFFFYIHFYIHSHRVISIPNLFGPILQFCVPHLSPCDSWERLELSTSQRIGEVKENGWMEGESMEPSRCKIKQWFREAKFILNVDLKRQGRNYFKLSFQVCQNQSGVCNKVV